MARFFTTHWQFKLWNPNFGEEVQPLWLSGSNVYFQRGVAPGDYVYVVSISHGQLFLGGRIVVADVVDRETAVAACGSDSLYDANDWLIGDESQGSRLTYRRCLSPEVTKRLRFLTSDGERKEPFFVNDTDLDVQATRGVRRLAPESAALLDDIIEMSDQLPDSDRLVVLTLDGIRKRIEARSEIDAALPNELPPNTQFMEGSMAQIVINRYERDAKARQVCLESNGTACVVCGFDFANEYGPEFAGFIHVHHLTPLSEIGKKYRIDPANDLVPVCPNCHAAIHRRTPPFEIEELQLLMLDQIENRDS